MRTSPLWPEFAGVHVVILATLIGIVVAIGMRRTDRVQRLAMTYAFVSQGTGIVLFVFWLSQTDWMMGHYQGPPFLLFSALASLALGVCATLSACVLCVARRAAGVSGQATTGVYVCWRLLLILTLASGFLAFGLFRATPRALRNVRIEYFRALESRGAAAIPQLVAGLKDEDLRVQDRACLLLGKLGPSAKEAVPDLVKYIETRNDEDDGYVEAVSAVIALGRIGPAAEPAIPVLVRLAKQEQSSWYVRCAVVEVLQGMGAPASSSLTTVLEFTQALAARQLPAQLDALKSTDPKVVQRAVGFLHAAGSDRFRLTMGVDAQAALPALQDRLAEIRQDKGRYAGQWWTTEWAIEGAIRHLTRESAERRR